MLKGINQWCYPDDTPLEMVFKYSRDAGFDAIELNVSIDGIGLTMNTSREEAKRIRKMAEHYRLRLSSISTNLLWKFPLSHYDEKVREQGRKVIEKQIELAGYIGADTVLVVPGVVNEETSYLDCYRRSQDELRKVLPLAEKHNIHVGIENVWNKFLLSPLEMARYIDEFHSDYIGAYYDVGNALQYGYPEQWISILGERIRKVHVKDFKLNVGNITGFVPLLAGDVNWEKVYQALKNIGYKDTVTAEIPAYAFGPEYLAQDTSKHLDVVLNLKKVSP
ncbi:MULTISPECIES: sugar phosphate isomerase/epimerase family protein [Niallia]|jgi:L-ribulose-5-phosphate 3-epimerase|uniref:Xylulose 5-phosphate 3-epimerase n=1 Tax=Niallia circulans TaxID=1397 RepID=A0A268FEB7_NIACI|nr:sugar phosphate isomerase/epimerase family protein [Niallia circulans]AYV68081.1 sugar phosphate isomerase/epimerase [Niallia circulans]AYV73544.1 sugar phosphate isomerase/epimerase [Niallia circulans]NRG26805.1 sugar phosphate isomerase/epimerase [Niallia circulans]PAD83702.1 xylulose 5-phosphate 3-epimerase [Niallia circulans]QJX63989.1 sugar phosphate isomerase/epimerase [Niallia circulans]